MRSAAKAVENVLARRRRDEFPRRAAALLGLGGCRRWTGSRLDGLVELSLPDRRLKQVVLRACAAAMILDRKRPAARDPRLAHVQSAATGARARTWRSPWIFGSDAGEQRHNVKVQRIGGHRLIGGGGGARVGLGTRSNHWVAVAGSASSSVRVLWEKKSCNVCLKA